PIAPADQAPASRRIPRRPVVLRRRLAMLPRACLTPGSHRPERHLMKTCPDCAESIQDAARKCRHCGYRYDEEGVATAALAAEPAAAASPRKKPQAKAKPPAEPAAARAPEP